MPAFTRPPEYTTSDAVTPRIIVLGEANTRASGEFANALLESLLVLLVSLLGTRLAIS